MSLNFKLKTLLLLCALSLTGCQYLTKFSSSHTDLLSPPALKTYHTVETHNFLVDYDQTLLGTLAAIETQYHDTLPDIARHYGLGHNDIISANPNVDIWLPEPGTRILLPLMFILPDAPHHGIVLNLANMRLFQFSEKHAEAVATYPVGIGRDGWNTPLGLTKIISKTKNPVWNVPVSIQREHAQKGDPLPSSVGAGPNNPLGKYAMRLALQSYLIHGTNKPYGIGMQMSHGCVNLYPEDIQPLFDNTKIGTEVLIVDQPYLLGWHQDMLFLEAHKPLQSGKNFHRTLLARIKRIAKQRKVSIDWSKVEQILIQANGVPAPILTQSLSLQQLAESAPLLQHPEQLYGQPLETNLSAYDWSVTAATLNDDRTARKLAALLSHQGPSIPARAVQVGEKYHVIAGPFATNKEANIALKRIRIEFELDGKVNPPQGLSAKEASMSDLEAELREALGIKP